jgi:hypothetical protein
MPASFAGIDFSTPRAELSRHSPKTSVLWRKRHKHLKTHYLSDSRPRTKAKTAMAPIATTSITVDQSIRK